MPQCPLILAIETSNPAERERRVSGQSARTADQFGAMSPDFGAVALCRGEGAGFDVLGAEPLLGGAARDDDLMPAIDRLFRRAGAAPRELGRVAVSVGPGGFTGVRIAVAATKAICEATGARAVGVPTALGVIRGVDPSLRSGGPVVVCLAWKRADVWRAVFPPNALQASGALAPLDRLFEGVDTPATLVMDSGLEARLTEAGGLSVGVRVERPRFDPVAIARASVDMAAVDPIALAPLYPREPEAVTKWRELGRGR